jgi:hypothetical protein
MYKGTKDDVEKIDLPLFYKYIFFGNENDKNKKHINKLCHCKTISYPMVNNYVELLNTFSVSEVARFKYLYDPIGLEGSDNAWSSVNFTYSQGANIDKLSKLSPKKICELEIAVHNELNCNYDFGCADGKVFGEPYKLGIPGKIEFISSQDELYKEGEEMDHCVAIYGAPCRDGYVSIYRVSVLDRCTLAIDNSSGHIIEMFGTGNRPAKPETWNTIREWLFD